MTRDEAREVMKKGLPVVWNGGGTAVQCELTYAFIISLNEKYNPLSHSIIDTVTLEDKNGNSTLEALVSDVRRAEFTEVLSYLGFNRT